MIVVDDLSSFNVLKTYIDGNLVAENGKTLIQSVEEPPVNFFHARKISPDELRVEAKGSSIRVIEALEGQLITHELKAASSLMDGAVVSNTGQDILKLVVMNRYTPSSPAVGFINGFGLNTGAIASTVAHDSHNIIAVGVNDEDIAAAINALVDSKGGICCIDGDGTHLLPLPVAGLMSNQDGYETARRYEMIDQKARNLGSKLAAPFMTLSFMALLVIPEFKLSDKGLFNGQSFSFASIFLD
jgi:adenine deaminase